MATSQLPCWVSAPVPTTARCRGSVLCSKWCGRLDAYNDSYDRASTKSSTSLGLHTERDFHYERIMFDPVVQVPLPILGPPQSGPPLREHLVCCSLLRGELSRAKSL